MAAKALRERLDRGGLLHIRTYDREGSVREVGGTLTDRRRPYLAVGGEVSSEDSSSRLIAAVRRGADGEMEHDPACGLAA